MSEVDEVTALPDSWDSWYRNYHNLALKTVRESGILSNDVEDSTASLEAKFFEKEGLSWFDPTRGTRFSSMYMRWLALSVRYEREKIGKYATRHVMYHRDWMSSVPDSESYLDEVEAENARVKWLEQATAVLHKVKRTDLLPSLAECVEASLEGAKFNRGKFARDNNLTDSRVRKNLMDLRRILSANGLGPESLRELQSE